MDDELLKLECLKLAADKGLVGQQLTEEAWRLFDFIKGRGKFSQVNYWAIGERDDLIGGGKARVVGKDGDVPFKDYKPE
jgi:hypothetical protein